MEFNVNKLRLAPGFRFRPTDEELIVYYLRPRVFNKPIPYNVVIADADVFGIPPEKLKDKAPFVPGDGNLFFFAERKRRYPKGGRPQRSTRCTENMKADHLTWTSTQTQVQIKLKNGKVIGTRALLKLMVNKKPTKWRMHEFKIEKSCLPPPKDDQGKEGYLDVVLCRVYKKKEGKFDNKNKDETEEVAHNPITSTSTMPLEEQPSGYYLPSNTGGSQIPYQHQPAQYHPDQYQHQYDQPQYQHQPLPQPHQLQCQLPPQLYCQPQSQLQCQAQLQHQTLPPSQPEPLPPFQPYQQPQPIYENNLESFSEICKSQQDREVENWKGIFP
ncbi:hypothetical protein AQUCO_01600364v1 [Aquilegia coerulea]|uniref:NAC domain-containing protein n=1 Tax=Aquilegia coerulea TaxID=218851 RepID=A0A2G5DR90_AQUCA|nr:hypothetical protein AQUCO_01600364v1 [Aquilegia coerulea]